MIDYDGEKQALADWGLQTDGASYAVNMWRHVLAMLHTPNAVDGSGAVPYVPQEVLSYENQAAGFQAVLDVGCLGGYGLFDFTVRRLSEGYALPRMTGVDISADSIALGQYMARKGVWGQDNAPSFLMAVAEGLPFDHDAFDLVLARLLLPYVDVEVALAELARVSVPGGLLLFQLHAPHYYLQRVWNSRRNWRWMLYYLRPIFSCAYGRVTGRQPRWMRWREMAMTPGMFSRWAERHGLEVVQVFGDRRRPMVICRNGRGAV